MGFPALCPGVPETKKKTKNKKKNDIYTKHTKYMHIITKIADS